jgi:hypothetical protein
MADGPPVETQTGEQAREREQAAPSWRCAERILPRASDLWVQASLDYKQRLQLLFFPEGMAFESADEKMVSQSFTSWNQMSSWLSQLQGLQGSA